MACFCFSVAAVPDLERLPACSLGSAVHRLELAAAPEGPSQSLASVAACCGLNVCVPPAVHEEILSPEGDGIRRLR